MKQFPVRTPAQLGSVLRGFRVDRGLTQAELARRVGTTQKAISIAETRPAHLTVNRLLQLLGALEAELLLGDSRRPPAKADW